MTLTSFLVYDHRGDIAGCVFTDGSVETGNRHIGQVYREGTVRFNGVDVGQVFPDGTVLHRDGHRLLTALASGKVYDHGRGWVIFSAPGATRMTAGGAALCFYYLRIYGY